MSINEQEEDLYKKATQIQSIKNKLKAKILEYISSMVEPNIEETMDYAKECAKKILNNASPIIIQTIGDYAGDLQNSYYSEIDVEHLLLEYLKVKE